MIEGNDNPATALPGELYGQCQLDVFECILLSLSLLSNMIIFLSILKQTVIKVVFWKHVWQNFNQKYVPNVNWTCIAYAIFVFLSNKPSYCAFKSILQIIDVFLKARIHLHMLLQTL